MEINPVLEQFIAQNGGFKYSYYVDAHPSLLLVGASGKDHMFAFWCRGRNLVLGIASEEDL